MPANNAGTYPFRHPAGDVHLLGEFSTCETFR